ncbi:MAG: hypothetical protein OEW39_12590, partial [Deltaproteobacteria bacterium]|nr:hypothetical protein [Deltaproteobacteria bacterium]
RSARMRLGFITRALSGVLEDFAALEAPQASVPPMLPDRVEGTLAELEHEGLAQACLVPGVKLSAEREAERRALPMEAHKLLQRLAPGSDPAKRHRVLVKRLESHLHQRVYNALVFLRHWAGLREKQKDAGFSRSSAYAELKSLAANFRHRLGALQTLEARLELVLYLMESLPGASGAHPPAQEFPREVFARAWGQFAGHALVAAVFGSGKIKGFAASRHWAETEARLKEQAQAGSAVALISLLLRRVQQRFSTETTDPGSGLAELVEVLLAGDGTFRFTIAQAAGLHTATRSTPGTPVPLRPLTVPERLMHLDAWAGVIADTASARARNAIRPGLK